MNGTSRTGDALPHATPFEALLIVLICFGLEIDVSLWVMSGITTGHTTGFRAAGDSDCVGMILQQLMMAAVALAVLWARRYPFRALYPSPSWRGVLEGAALCATVAGIGVAAHYLLAQHAGPSLTDIFGKMPASLPSVIALSIVSAVFHEVFLLGYLMRGLRRFGASMAIGIPVLLRLLLNTGNGPVVSLAAVLGGIVLGVYYQRTDRLFPVVMAQAIATMAALTLGGQGL